MIIITIGDIVGFGILAVIILTITVWLIGNTISEWWKFKK